MSKFHVAVDLDLCVRWLLPSTSQVEKNRRAFLEERLRVVAGKISVELQDILSALMEEACL